MLVPAKYLSDFPAEKDYLVLTNETETLSNGELIRLCYVFNEAGKFRYGRWCGNDMLATRFPLELEIEPLPKAKMKKVIIDKYEFQRAERGDKQ